MGGEVTPTKQRKTEEGFADIIRGGNSSLSRDESGTASSGGDSPNHAGSDMRTSEYDSYYSPLVVPLQVNHGDEPLKSLAEVLLLPRGRLRRRQNSMGSDSVPLPSLPGSVEARDLDRGAACTQSEQQDPGSSDEDCAEAADYAVGQDTGDEYFDAVAALPELLHRLGRCMKDLRKVETSRSTDGFQAVQARKYVVLLFNEIECVLRWTIIRPEIADRLGEEANVPRFLELWAQICDRMPDADLSWSMATDDDESVLVRRTVAAARDVVTAWYQWIGTQPLPPPPGAPAILAAAGQVPGRSWNATLPSLVLAHLFAALAAALASGAAVGGSTPMGAAGGLLLLLATVVSCTLLCISGRRGNDLLVASVVLLLLICSTSPLALHWSIPEAAVPWGLLFLPSWTVAVAIAVDSRGPETVRPLATLYCLAFAGRSALVAFGIPDTEAVSAAWVSDAVACFVVLAAVLLGDMTRQSAVPSRRRALSESTRAKIYRRSAVDALQLWHSEMCYGRGDAWHTAEDLGKAVRQHTQILLRIINRIGASGGDSELVAAARQELTSLMTGPGVKGSQSMDRHNSVIDRGSRQQPRFGASVRFAGNRSVRPKGHMLTSPTEGELNVPEGRAGEKRKQVGFGEVMRERSERASERADEDRKCTGLVQASPYGEVVFPDSADDVIRVCARGLHQHIVLIVITEEGEVVYWNTKAATLTGMPSASVHGYEVTSFLTEETDQEKLDQMIDDAVAAAKEDPWNGEDAPVPTSPPQALTFLRADGVSRVKIELTAAGSYLPGHVILQGTEAARDTTQTDAKWVVAQMWPGLDELFLQIEGMGLDEDDPLVSQARGCRSLSVSLINLMAVNSRQASEVGFAPLRIGSTMNKIVSDFQPAAREKGVTLRLLPFAHDLPHEFRTHTQKLPRAIAYLISNAIRYSMQDGTVEVSVAQDLTATTERTLKDLEPGGCIRFTVRDTGRGIPRQEVEHIFSRNRPPKPDGGQGKLGLPNTNLVVQEIGGYISVESDTEPPERGTTFTIVLPLLRVQQGECESEFDDASEDGAARGENVPVKVVLVETNAVYRMNFCHHLWARSYSLTIASSLMRVLDSLDSTDLIIVDIETAPFEIEDLLEKLKLAAIQVMLVSKLFTEFQRNIIQEAGWYGCSLPLRREELNGALDSVEEKVNILLEQKAQIEEFRRAFAGNAQCPWERGRTLGQGSFGKVFEATNKITGGKMACKTVILRGGGDQQEAQLAEILKEVAVMAQLEHPNIVHYFYCEKAQDELHIFMELAEATLSGKIPKSGMAAEDASGYLQDILLGLQYLHSKNIVHRDIKVANVLISRGVCKLTDFGTAAKLPKPVQKKQKEGEEEGKAHLQDTAGTPQYMSPEVIREEGHDWRADIWSVGCLVMEMLTGKQPFSHIGGNSWAVIKYVGDLTTRSKVDVGPFRYHPAALGFMYDCLHVDPSKRKSCGALLESELIELHDSVARKQSVFGIATETRKQSIAQHATKRGHKAGARVKAKRSSPGTDAGPRQPKAPAPPKETTGWFRPHVDGRKPSYATGVPPCPDSLKQKPTVEDGDSDGRRDTEFSGWGGHSDGRRGTNKQSLDSSDRSHGGEDPHRGSQAESSVSSWGT
eukprot:TRINITY_DN2245_c1_g2_i1.p1 TRINITY_DN2245_c1_g2~~TRINITY_DN2245_c1_g2_i1.p1  ORF type:complete len:1617 (+),score=478.62 TRINITY_DN2245_c1_g2_i1:244-5094(+)